MRNPASKGCCAVLLSMMAACFGAMVVMNLLGVPPIYDLLRDRAERRLQQASTNARPASES
jgi:H+/Cl- antiporter ClcA